MNTYSRVYLRNAKKFILRNMDRKVVATPKGKVVCFAGVEVNGDGEAITHRVEGKTIDETFHVVELKAVQRIQPLVMSPKYACLVTLKELQEEGPPRRPANYYKCVGCDNCVNADQERGACPVCGCLKWLAMTA